MNRTDLSDAWDNPQRPWPQLVYVETSSLCNYRCPCCHNWEMHRPKCVMSLEDFKAVADKVLARGLKIGAMYCNAEPLTDKTIFDKYAYANRIGALVPRHVGLNTNASLLTPEKFGPMVENCPNVIISIFATGEDYARATGGFPWEPVYKNILDFIAYRDQHKPEFNIFIGCNQIPGQKLDDVKKAFEGLRVSFETDVFIDWNTPDALTGPLRRMEFLYPNWRCDGVAGHLQIRPDGACGTCPYDFHGLPDGTLETYVGNILTDSWEVLEANFRERWKRGFSVCQRCDAWHHGRSLIPNYPGTP